MKIKNWHRFQHYKGRNPPWIKLHRKLLDDPEWFALDGDASKVLAMCWLVAAETDGNLPASKMLAFRLRISEPELAKQIAKLSHWLEFDASELLAPRLQDACLETDTEREVDTESEKISDAKASAGDDDFNIPEFMRRDPRAELFDRGLKTFIEITGRTPNSARAFLGQQLKTVHDDAVLVLGAIDDAKQNRVADPSGWIIGQLGSHRSNRNGKPTVQEAARKLVERLEEMQPGYSRATGAGAVRLLPARGGK